MAMVKRSALVPYRAEFMYGLVDDIESYPRFLPWCRAATVDRINEDEVRATIQISKGALQKSFTTINRLQKNKMMEIRLVEGPFKRLEGFWQFDALSESACKVSLHLSFEFAGPVISRVVGPVFHQIANSLVDAFCKRARDLHGDN
jgi:ribosome-associated toxin RatA of RatAB toxin-antitoxin module